MSRLPPTSPDDGGRVVEQTLPDDDPMTEVADELETGKPVEHSQCHGRMKKGRTAVRLMREGQACLGFQLEHRLEVPSRLIVRPAVGTADRRDGGRRQTQQLTQFPPERTQVVIHRPSLRPDHGLEGQGPTGQRGLEFPPLGGVEQHRFYPVITGRLDAVQRGPSRHGNTPEITVKLQFHECARELRRRSKKINSRPALVPAGMDLALG